MYYLEYVAKDKHHGNVHMVEFWDTEENCKSRQNKVGGEIKWKDTKEMKQNY